MRAVLPLLLLFSCFSTVMGQPSRGFLPFLNGPAERIVVQPDGNILVSGRFLRAGSDLLPQFGRLAANGDADTSFTQYHQDFGCGSFTVACVIIVRQPDGKILTVRNPVVPASNRFNRLNPDGTLDASFTPPVFSSTYVSTEIHAVAVAPDGKIYVGGYFELVDGVWRPHLIRLNQDGSVDSSFGPAYVHAGYVKDIFVLPDGRFYVGGTFTAIGGQWRTGIARLNPNGTADTTFADHGLPPPRQVRRIYVQSDGKVLANGSIFPPGDTLFDRLTRLNSNGTIDSSFNPPAGDSNGKYRCLEEPTTPDKLLCIITYSPTVRPAVLRLNKSDGSIDTTYRSPNLTGYIDAIALQPDGKLLFGGDLTLAERPYSSYLARLNADGTVEIPRLALFDYDGDRKADISVFRPSTGKWYILGSQSGFRVVNWGQDGDLIVPADYDGDEITDTAVFRPSNNTWYIVNSRTSTFAITTYGVAGDIPVPGRYDRDRKADVALFRSSNNSWYVRGSIVAEQMPRIYGSSGDIPLGGNDFDGDLLSDLTVYRPSNRRWFVRRSAIGDSGFAPQWGEPTDKRVPADYDGDGLSDHAVFRPSTGQWFIIGSSTGWRIVTWGVFGDIPVPADYDGDGKTDIGIFRPANNNWYIIGSATGIRIVQFGASGDIPTPQNFN